MKTTRTLPVLLAAALLAGGCINGAPNAYLIKLQFVENDLHDRVAAMPPAADRTFALASPFSDHMVLQRDCPIPVWGTGMPRETVFVRLFDGDGGNRRCIAKGTATIGENGRWCAVLPQQLAGGPYALVVEHATPPSRTTRRRMRAVSPSRTSSSATSGSAAGSRTWR